MSPLLRVRGRGGEASEGGREGGRARVRVCVWVRVKGSRENFNFTRNYSQLLSREKRRENADKMRG